MAYKKLGLKNGVVVDETHMNHIEHGIVENETNIAKRLPKSGYNPDKFLGTDKYGNVIEKEPPSGTTEAKAPHIGENGNWFIGDTDTGVKAAGEDGVTPHIGENGNWFIGDTDTGVKAEASSDEFPIKLLENTDSANRIPLRTLASGMYILKGYFTSYTGGSDKYTFSTGMLVSVVNSGTITYVQIFYAKYNTLQYLEITDSSVTRKDAQLVNMESMANKVTDITEAATDSQYPTAKAVYEVKNELSESKAGKTGWGANKFIGTDANGNMVEREAPQTGTGGIAIETDPTVPAWAKAANKPTYTADEVGALPDSTQIPTKTSDLENDSGYITKAVSDLVNYYTKSQTYTQAEVNALVSAIPKFSISVVSSLPTSGISGTTVYLVNSGTSGDLYTEYIYVGGAWEILGSQRVDLTGYATEAWVNAEIADFLTVDKLTAAMIEGALGYTPANKEEVDADLDGISNYVPKSGTTMIGELVAQNNTNYAVKQVRNVILLPEGSELPTGANGDICWIYEV